ncbi:MAG: hypothetical protein ACXVB0_08970 [Mucilaginibacter sp.]
MKIKLILIIIAIGGVISAKAQQADTVPNHLLANQISTMILRLGLPPDSAISCLTYFNQFKKLEGSPSTTDIFYGCQTYDVVFDFKKSEDNHLQLIICDMPVSMMSTAREAIDIMGMIKTNVESAPGFTGYATAKYAAFLNPEVRKGYLELVLVQGGK